MKRTMSLLVMAAVGILAATANAEMSTMPSGPATAPPSTPAPPVSNAEDPIESFNRKIFSFNDGLDTYVLAPVATGWDTVVPKRAQTCVSNFFANLRVPIDTVNNVLQGKPTDAAVVVGRFLVNTTAGVAGFFDPASSLGMQPHVEDFGQTLGIWGVGPGPYLVLPILGPSTVRDGGGLIVDYPMSITPFFVDWYYTTGARVVETVNYRASILDQVKQAKEASVDYYSFVRNAYLQRRAALISGQTNMSESTQTDLYHPED